MNNPKELRIQDYTYTLPAERIARYPLPRRDESKLLVYNKGQITSDVFKNITSYLPAGTLMVCNNTKVIQARLHFSKSTGAMIEVFLLEPFMPSDYEQAFQSRGECSWICMIGNLKKWKSGGEPLSRQIMVGGEPLTLSVTLGEEKHTGHVVRFTWTAAHVSFAEILEAVGELPIPPYLNRETEESDKLTYQTVYSRIKGSVAAPTAGLHFTDAVLADIERHGVEREEVTLHVGAGTFKPVKAERIEGHEMHQEYICVHRHTVESILRHNIDVTAVGTTSVRTLESLYFIGCKLLNHLTTSPTAVHQADNLLTVEQWEPYENNFDASPHDALQAVVDWMELNKQEVLHTTTRIIIVPGYNYHIVKRLITNFHQPQSTLLLLVSAMIGEDWRRVYDYALANDFRFLSYGDSSLLIP